MVMIGVRESRLSDWGFADWGSGNGNWSIGSRSSPSPRLPDATGSDGRAPPTGGPTGSGSNCATPPPVGSKAIQP